MLCKQSIKFARIFVKTFRLERKAFMRDEFLNVFFCYTSRNFRINFLLFLPVLSGYFHTAKNFYIIFLLSRYTDRNFPVNFYYTARNFHIKILLFHQDIKVAFNEYLIIFLSTFSLKISFLCKSDFKLIMSNLFLRSSYTIVDAKS